MIHTISSRFGLFLCFIVLIILVTFYIHHKNEPSGSERNAQILSVSITCDGESLELSELRDYLETNHLESDAVFIIKYSILDCIQCDKEIMNTICHFFSETKKNPRIVFLASGFRTKDYSEYGHTLYLDRGNTSLLDSFSSPVLFVYKDSLIMHTYLPIVKEKGELLNYLSLINNRYKLGGSANALTSKRNDDSFKEE